MNNGTAILDSQIGEDMSNIKIHIKSKKVIINEQGCIKLDKEAAKLLSEVAYKSGKSVRQIASEIIKQSIKQDMIVLDKEEEE